MEKEYIVSLNRDIDYDQFWNEMENPTNGLKFIPDRRIDIINERLGSLRSCHYALSDQEANILRQDPRIYSVEIPPTQRSDLKIKLHRNQIGNFSKPYTYAYNSFINWGLKRVSSPMQNYISKFDQSYGYYYGVNNGYEYTLDGTGVDIVIQDSGIQANHPEFTDEKGISRVKQINWYTASNLPGSQSSNHYSDTDGHGTHVAGITAGKNFGWAKNAHIYSVKVDGLDGGEGGGIPIEDCFDVIKQWHLNKPINPLTGTKRPTIVNMSWGYASSFSYITGGNYRGTNWLDNTKQLNYGMIGVSNYHGVRVDSVDVDVQEMIDIGIHICKAAGNSSQKIDVPSGLDYNNYYTRSDYPENIYYHRGNSPYDDQIIVVGNIDSSFYSLTTDQKAISSNSGPGVDIWAPGTNIVSAYCSEGFVYYPLNYYQFNHQFRQEMLSGTSMASPQVAGLGALILQLYPTSTPAQLKNFLIYHSKSTIYSTGLDNDYTNDRSILNSNNRMLYNPFNSSTPISIKGPILSNIQITLK